LFSQFLEGKIKF